MSEIPNIVFIAIPFVLGHLISYSWLTWQRRKRSKQYLLDDKLGEK